jgi:hypothetical protein
MSSLKPVINVSLEKIDNPYSSSLQGEYTNPSLLPNLDGKLYNTSFTADQFISSGPPANYEQQIKQRLQSIGLNNFSTIIGNNYGESVNYQQQIQNSMNLTTGNVGVNQPLGILSAQVSQGLGNVDQITGKATNTTLQNQIDQSVENVTNPTASAQVMSSAASSPDMKTPAFQGMLRQEEVDTGNIDSMTTVLKSQRWELGHKTLFDYLGSINGQTAKDFSGKYLENLQKYSNPASLTTPEDKENAYQFGKFRQFLLSEELRKSFMAQGEDRKARDVRKDFELKIFASNKILGITDEKNNPLLAEMDSVIIPAVRKALGDEAVSKDWRQQLAFKDKDVKETKLVTGDKLLAEINKAIQDTVNSETNKDAKYSLTSMMKPFEEASVAKLDGLYKSEHYKALIQACGNDKEKLSKVMGLAAKAVQEGKSLADIETTLKTQIPNINSATTQHALKFMKESYGTLGIIMGTDQNESIPRSEMFKKLRATWNNEAIDPARYALSFILNGAGTQLQFNQDESQATGEVADHRSVLAPHDKQGSAYKYVAIDDNQKLRREIDIRLKAQLAKVNTLLDIK